MERSVVVFTCLIIGFLFFAAFLSFHEKMEEPSRRGEMKVILREINTTIAGMIGSGRDAYVYREIKLPGDLNGKSFTVSFSPGKVEITSNGITESIGAEVQNSKTYDGGEVIRMEKYAGSESVVVF